MTELTSRAGPFRDHQNLSLLFAGISPQKTLVLVIFVVGAADRNIVIVALEIKRKLKH